MWGLVWVYYFLALLKGNIRKIYVLGEGHSKSICIYVKLSVSNRLDNLNVFELSDTLNDTHSKDSTP